jgi:hypothetical protein
MDSRLRRSDSSRDSALPGAADDGHAAVLDFIFVARSDFPAFSSFL